MIVRVSFGCRLMVVRVEGGQGGGCVGWRTPRANGRCSSLGLCAIIMVRRCSRTSRSALDVSVGRSWRGLR